MTTLLIEQALLQDILNYLAARPYGEVYRLVDGICNLQPVDQQPAAAEPSPVSADVLAGKVQQ